MYLRTQDLIPFCVCVQTITRNRYAADMKFEDPLVKFSNLDGFAFNTRVLKSVFKIEFTLHDITTNGPEEIRTRYILHVHPLSATASMMQPVMQAAKQYAE